MKKKWLITLIVILGIFIITFFYNNFFTKNMVLGAYVNTNYQYGPFLAEVPYVQDTLTLFSDDHFTSAYYGTGTYQLHYSVRGTKIELIYDSGNASYIMPINRNNVVKFKIVISDDNNHYYRQL